MFFDSMVRKYADMPDLMDVNNLLFTEREYLDDCIYEHLWGETHHDVEYGDE